MTSPLEAYLRDNPDLRGQDRQKLIDELYQTSGVEVPREEFVGKLLRDPDNLLGFRAQQSPPKEVSGADVSSSLGARSIFGELAQSAGRALKLYGQVYQGEVPVTDPQTGRTSQELIERSTEAAGWMSPMARGRAFGGAPAAGRTPVPKGVDDIIRNVPPNDPVYSRIVPHPKRTPGELTTGFDRFYSMVKDKFHALNRAEKFVTGEWAGANEPALLAEESPFKLVRLMQGNPGRAEHFLEHGTYDFGTGKITGPSLKAIVEPVEQDMKGAMRYALAKRAIEKAAQGKETGIDLAAAQKVVADVETAGTPLAQNVMKFQKDLTTYNEALLKMIRDSGMLTPEEFEAIKAANQDYLPFYRLIDDRLGGAAPGKGSQNPVKKMLGSDLEILDPLESVIRNTYAFIHIAERNRAAQALYRLVEMDETKTVGEVVQQPVKAIQLAEAETQNFLKQYDIETTQPGAFTIFRPTSSQGGNTIEFRINGKRRAMLVDPEIAKAWQQLDGFSANAIEQWLGAPARLLRAGVTLDPGFSIRNLIRDQFMPLATMPGVYRPFYDAQLGLSQILHNGPMYLEWMRAGGANSSMVSIDQQYLKILRNRLVKTTSDKLQLPGVVRHPIEALRALSNLGENATRVGGYMRARQMGYDPMDAAFVAREMTIDFARMGSVVQHLNRVAAFSNAQMEGPDRFVRALAARPGAVTTALVGGITMPSLALWAINHNDPRYKEMPRWQKDIYWPMWVNPDWRDITEREAATLKHSLPIRTLPSGRIQADYGKPILVPKPFELGVIYGSLPERMAEKFLDDNPNATKDFVKSLTRALLPNLMPTFMSPQLEIQSNYSFYFDRPIVSRSLEQLVPELRYTEYTTELAKQLAKVFDRKLEPLVDDPELTPIAVEHWVRNWTGTMGYNVLQLTDWGLRKAGVLPQSVGPEWTTADWPVIRAFTTRYPSTLSQSISDFYSAYFKQEQLTRSIRELGRRPDKTEDQEILRATKNITKVREYYGALRANAQMVNDIMRNPDMNEKDKRNLIDQHIFRMIAASQQGLQIMRADKAKPKPEPREPQQQYESDLRMERFGAVQDNKTQSYMLSQMELPEQMKFAPYAHADTKGKFIIWWHNLDAVQQDTVLELTDQNTQQWWMPYSHPEVQKKYNYSGISLSPPSLRTPRAPQPEKPAWGTRPPDYPKGAGPRSAPPPKAMQDYFDQKYGDQRKGPNIFIKPSPLPPLDPEWQKRFDQLYGTPNAAPQR
jgi:hypothetical protein